MSASPFQQMAPNIQRALGVTLALGAVAAVIYMFCVQAEQTALVKARQELEAMQTQQANTVRDLRSTQQVKEQLDRLDAERQPYLDAMLTPLLASYAMRAKSILDPIAAESGLMITDYAELPQRLLPLPKPQAVQLYARQPIKLTCAGTYAEVVSFLMRVEKLMPLVAMQSFSLKVQQNNDVQNAVIVLEWPVVGVNTAPVAANGGPRK